MKSAHVMNNLLQRMPNKMNYISANHVQVWWLRHLPLGADHMIKLMRTVVLSGFDLVSTNNQ